MENINYFSEQFFQAVELLIDQHLNQVSFDETIPCTIVELLDEHTRQYKVSYNLTTYKAYAKAGEVYQKDDLVYVNIPQGDYTSDVKIILGKYVLDKEDALEYKNPLSDLAFTTETTLLENNLISNRTFEFSREEHASIFEQLTETTLSGYDLMGLELGLTIDNLTSKKDSGSWVIYLELYDKAGQILHSGIDQISPYFFSSQEVSGTPYKLFSTMLQRKLFAFPSSLQLSKINKICLRVLQSSDFNGTITVNSCNLSFGYDAKRFAQKPIHVYVEGNYNGNFSYNENGEIVIAGTEDIQSEITLSALLISQEKNTVLPMVPDQQVIRWYKYSVGEQGDSLGGGYWKFLGANGAGDKPEWKVTASDMNLEALSTSFKAVLCQELAQPAIQTVVVDYWTNENFPANHDTSQLVYYNNYLYEYIEGQWDKTEYTEVELYIKNKYGTVTGTFPFTATVALIELKNMQQVDKILYYTLHQEATDAAPVWSTSNALPIDVANLSAVGTSDTFVFYNIKNENSYGTAGTLRAVPSQTQDIVAYDINNNLITTESPILIELYYDGDERNIPKKLSCELGMLDERLDDTLIYGFSFKSDEKPIKVDSNTKFVEWDNTENKTYFTIYCHLKDTYDPNANGGTDNQIVFKADDEAKAFVTLSFKKQEKQNGFFTIRQVAPADMALYGVDQQHLRKDIDTTIQLVAETENINVDLADCKWSLKVPGQAASITQLGKITLQKTYIPSRGDLTVVVCTTKDGLYYAEYEFTVGKLSRAGLADSHLAYTITPNRDHFAYYNATNQTLFSSAPQSIPLSLKGLTKELTSTTEFNWSYDSPNGQLTDINNEDTVSPSLVLNNTFVDAKEPENVVTCIIDNAYVVQAIFTFGLSTSDGTILLDAAEQDFKFYSEITNTNVDDKTVTVVVMPMNGAWPGWGEEANTGTLEIVWRFPDPDCHTSLLHWPVGINKNEFDSGDSIYASYTQTFTSNLQSSYSLEFSLASSWDATKSLAINNKVFCTVNGHTASMTFSFGHIESNNIASITYADDNWHFPVYSQNNQLLSWVEPIELIISPVSGKWPATTPKQFVWNTSSPLIAGFAESKDSSDWKTSVSSTKTSIWCKFKSMISSDNYNRFQEIVCTIDNRYRATANLTFGRIESTGVVTLDATTQTITAYNHNGGRLSNIAYVPIEIELPNTASLTWADVNQIEWSFEGDFFTGFSVLENATSPTSKYTWKRTSGSESPPTRINAYLINSWVDTSSNQKIKCRLNGVDEYSASISFTFGKISEEEIIILTPSRDQISAYNLTGIRFNEFKPGISLNLKTLPGKSLLQFNGNNTHDISITFSRNIITDLTFNGITSTDGSLSTSLTLNSDQTINTDLTARIKNDISSVTTFTDVITVLIDNLYYATAELTFNKIDINYDKLRIDAEGYYVPYGLYSQKPVHDADKYIKLSLLDLAGNPLTAIDGISINSTVWTLKTTGKSIAGISATSGLPTAPSSATVTTKTNTIYAYIATDTALSSLSDCQISCTVNSKYTATIPLHFEYADPDNVNAVVFGNLEVLNLANKVASKASDLELRISRRDGQPFKKVTYSVTGTSPIITPSNYESETAMSGLVSTIYLNKNTAYTETQRTASITCTVDDAYRTNVVINFTTINPDGAFIITPSKDDIPAYNSDIEGLPLLTWWENKNITLTAQQPSLWPSVDPNLNKVQWSLVSPSDSNLQQIALGTGQNSLTSTWTLANAYKQSGSGRQEHVVQCIIDETYRATAILDFSLASGSGAFELDADEYDWEYSLQTGNKMPYNTTRVAITPRTLDQTILDANGSTHKHWYVYNSQGTQVLGLLYSALSGGSTLAYSAGDTPVYFNLNGATNQAYTIKCVAAKEIATNSYQDQSDCYATIKIAPSKTETQNIAQIKVSTGSTTLPIYGLDKKLINWYSTVPITLSVEPVGGQWPESSVVTSHTYQWTLPTGWGANTTSTQTISLTPPGDLGNAATFSCTVDNAYTASIVLYSAVLDKTAELSIASNQPQHIICYSAGGALDSKVPASQGIVLEAVMSSGTWPNGSTAPQTITWEIPEGSDTLLSELTTTMTSSQVNILPSYKEGSTTRMSKITMTKIAGNSNDVPSTITCKLASTYQSAYASEQYNQIKCTVDGVAVAVRAISFGQGDTDGGFFLTAEDTTAVPAYSESGARIKDNVQIQVTPSKDVASSWIGKTISWNYDATNGLLRGTGMGTAKITTNPHPITIPLADTWTENGSLNVNNRIEVAVTDLGEASTSFSFAKQGVDTTLQVYCQEGAYVVGYDKGKPTLDYITFIIRSSNGSWPGGAVTSIKWEILNPNSTSCLLESLQQDSTQQTNWQDISNYLWTEDGGTTYKIRCRLKQQFSTAQSNIVRCTINGKHAAIGIVNFGQLTQGTQYSFSIIPAMPYLENTVGNTLALEAALEYVDPDNPAYSQSVDLTNKNVQWTWHAGTNYTKANSTNQFSEFYSIETGERFVTFEDLAKALGYPNIQPTTSSIMVRKEDNTLVSITRTNFNNGNTTVISEPYIAITTPQGKITQLRLAHSFSSSFTSPVQTETISTTNYKFQSESPIAVREVVKKANKLSSSACCNYILKATCKMPPLYDNGDSPADKEVTLEAFYPVPIRTANSLSPSSTPGGVFNLEWDSDGVLTNSTEVLNIPYEQLPNGYSWTIQYPYEVEAEDKAYKIVTQSSKQYLVPSTYAGTTPILSEYKFSNANVPCIYNYYWQQPLFISISKYDIDMTNKWSGSSVWIDEQQHTVMATTLGAGEKNPHDNTFTGVLMGKFTKGTSGNIANGLYGFHNGISTFGIDANTGDAYFKGHIEATSGNIGMWTLNQDTFVAMDVDQDGPYRLGWISPVPIKNDTNYTYKIGNLEKDWIMYLGGFVERPDEIDHWRPIAGFGVSNDGWVACSNLYLGAASDTSGEGSIFFEVATGETYSISQGATSFQVWNEDLTEQVWQTMAHLTFSGRSIFDSNIWFTKGLMLLDPAEKMHSFALEPGRGIIAVDQKFRIRYYASSPASTSGLYVNLLEYNNNSNVVIGYRGGNKNDVPDPYDVQWWESDDRTAAEKTNGSTHLYGRRIIFHGSIIDFTVNRNGSDPMVTGDYKAYYPQVILPALENIYIKGRRSGATITNSTLYSLTTATISGKTVLCLT